MNKDCLVQYGGGKKTTPKQKPLMHASWKTNLKVIYSIFGLFDQVILLKKD